MKSWRQWGFIVCRCLLFVSFIISCDSPSTLNLHSLKSPQCYPISSSNLQHPSMDIIVNKNCYSTLLIPWMGSTGSPQLETEDPWPSDQPMPRIRFAPCRCRYLAFEFPHPSLLPNLISSVPHPSISQHRSSNKQPCDQSGANQM